MTLRALPCHCSPWMTSSSKFSRSMAFLLTNAQDEFNTFLLALLHPRSMLELTSRPELNKCVPPTVGSRLMSFGTSRRTSCSRKIPFASLQPVYWNQTDGEFTLSLFGEMMVFNNTTNVICVLTSPLCKCILTCALRPPS